MLSKQSSQVPIGRETVNQAWLVLTKRYGGDVRSPTEKQLASALHEVYVEEVAERNGNDASDHGSAVLRFGYDDGLMYVLEVMCGGTVTFEEWADQDCEIELAPPRHMTAVPKEQALQLWQWLAHRQVAKIRSQPWISG